MLHPISAVSVVLSMWGWLLSRAAWQSPGRQDSLWGTGTGLGVRGDGEHGRTTSRRVHFPPLLLWPVLLGKLCCLGTGKGKDWQTGLGPVALPSNLRLRQNLLVLLCACSYTLYSSKACRKCSGHRSSPTYTGYRGLGPCSISERSHFQVPELYGTISPCCPWHCPGALQHPAVALRLLGASGFPCPQPAAPTIASVW